VYSVTICQLFCLVIRLFILFCRNKCFFQLLKYATFIYRCPGFGQDMVNFHRTPGRGTARGWGLTPPGQTEPGIPYPVQSRCVRGGRGGNSLAARERAAPVLSERAGLLCEFVSYFLLTCIVVVTVASVCCSVKLPLSRPTSFLPVFFPFSSAPRQGEGQPRGTFVASCSRNQNIKLAPRCGAGIMAGLSSGC